MEYRAGYSGLPCCGVYAVALVADVPFHKAWFEIAKYMKRPNAWKGRTTHRERYVALGWLGKRTKRVDCPRGISLRVFVEDYTRKGGVYIVTLGSHIVAVKDGLVCDQYEHAPIAVHGSKKKRVRHAEEVY